MKLKLSIGNSRMDKKWNAVEMELSEFRDRISQTKRTAETVEQYRKLSKAKHQGCGRFCPRHSERRSPKERLRVDPFWSVAGYGLRNPGHY